MRNQENKRIYIYLVILNTLMVLSSAYLVYFDKTDETPKHQSPPNPVAAPQPYPIENKTEPAQTTPTEPPIPDLSIYQNRWQILKKQREKSLPQVVYLPSKPAREMIVLYYHENKLIHAEVNQPDATPASKAEYWFYENQLLKADLWSGKTEAAGGRSSAGVTRTDWSLNQSFWFDEKNNIIDKNQKFNYHALHPRYQDCAVCVPEAQMILANAPDGEHKPIDEKAFKLPSR